MLEQESIKPCPFCASSDILTQDLFGDHWVICNNCRIGTCFENSIAAAIHKWNTRA